MIEYIATPLEIDTEGSIDLVMDGMTDKAPTQGMTEEWDISCAVEDIRVGGKISIATPSGEQKAETQLLQYRKEDIYGGEDDLETVQKGDQTVKGDEKGDKIVERVRVGDGDNGWKGEDSNKCVFKRGVCTKHKLKGKKITNNSKRWGQKKEGYGWIYSKTVKYICPHDKCLSGQTKLDTDVQR